MISLEKYKGRRSRHTCPNCNHKNEFTRYIGDDGNYLDDNVGRCNRETNCGYHYSPKQFYADNPNRSNKSKIDSASAKETRKIQAQPVVKSTDFIDFEIFAQTLRGNYEQNAFIKFLMQLFPQQSKIVELTIKSYFIGTYKDFTVFPKINKSRKICSGKLMKFDASTGKRLKADYSISSLQHELKKIGKLKEDFETDKNAFFGEHLLINEPNKIIAITEAEKTAVIASIYFPDKIWLATGAKSHLRVDKLERLGARNIILYPDGDAFDDWNKIAEEAQGQGMNVKISTLIENKEIETAKKNGKDLADYLVDEQLKINAEHNKSEAATT